MRLGLAGSVLVLAAPLPLQAMALECVEYDIRGAFWSYQHSEGTYVLVQGEFNDIRSAFPGDNTRADLFEAQFRGHSASRRAFDQPFEAKVLLDLSYATLLTGGHDLAVEAAKGIAGNIGLVWLEQTDTGYTADYSPCWPLVDTDPANVKPALQCLRGGYCPKD